MNKNEKKYQGIFEQAPVGMARLKPDGTLLEVNKKFCDILGYSKKELLTKKFSDITHPDDLEAGLNYVKQLLNGECESYSMNKRYLTKTRTIVLAMLTVSLVRTIDNKPDYFIAIIDDISSQKNDQASLIESEKKFHAVFEQAGGYNMILNPNTLDGIPIIVDANEAACKIHGYTREDFIGRPISDVDDKAGKLLVKKRTAEIMTGKPFYIENTHIRQDGTSFSVAVNAKRVDISEETSFIFSTEYDISQREKAEKLFQKSNNLLMKLSDALPAVIYQFRLYPDGRSSFPYASTGIENIYEVRAKDVIDNAQSAFHVIHPDDLAMLSDSINTSAKTMKLWSLEYRVQLPKKGLRWLRGNAKPEKLEDGSTLWHGFIEDITELKHKDKMLIDQSRNAAMGEMVSMIAHQWRQPISVIAMDANNMLLDIALEDFDTIQAEKYAHNITKQTQNLSQTIDDFRNFFKPDKALLEVNIKEILASTLVIVKDSLRNNSIEFNTSFETEKKVQAYPRELMQVFVNIINNSKDALTVHKSDNPFINVKVYEDKKYINTEICDNGGGIDNDLLLNIFNPYFSTKDEKTGTGIGLYMSKMIIEKHLNGIIEVHNKDEGICFTVKLQKN